MRTSPLGLLTDLPLKHVSNLCSAFSYCLTLLGTCYVWHGKGSLPGERQAALEYALSFVTGSRPVELVEQVSDDNEMFWMMLGDADYARADYWKWRPDLAATALPRIWRVDASSTPGPYVRNDPSNTHHVYNHHRSLRSSRHSPPSRTSIYRSISLTVSGNYSF